MLDRPVWAPVGKDPLCCVHSQTIRLTANTVHPAFHFHEHLLADSKVTKFLRFDVRRGIARQSANLISFSVTMQKRPSAISLSPPSSRPNHQVVFTHGFLGRLVSSWRRGVSRVLVMPHLICWHHNALLSPSSSPGPTLQTRATPSCLVVNFP